MKRVCCECGKSLSELPFVCKFCGGQYCSEHRLPESHNCPHLEDARKKSQKKEIPPTDDADALEIPEKIVKNSMRIEKREDTIKREMRRYLSYPDSDYYLEEEMSNRLEVTHLTIATMIIFSVTLLFELPIILTNISNPPFLTVVITIGALISVTAFIGRYLAQKYTALKMQLGIRFRIVLITSILTFLSAFLPLAVISPGVMVPEDMITTFEEAKIKLPGPLINLILGLVSFGLWLNLNMIDASASFLALISLRVNTFMGLTSMIPIGLFEGQSIYNWDKRVWIAIVFCFLVIYLGSLFL